MAGKIIVSTLQSDTDNSISFVANTGATIFSANLSNGIAGSFIGAGSITGDKIVSSPTITGNVTINGSLGIGGTTPASSGFGITFPATQSASTDANTLDDYEEGTWTGTIKGLSTDPTTPVTATGSYTKIGRLVFARIHYSAITTTGASGAFYVSGLPFTAADADATGNVMAYDLMTYSGSNLSPYVTGTSVFFYQMSSNAAWNPATHNAGSNRYLIVSVTYQV